MPERMQGLLRAGLRATGGIAIVASVAALAIGAARPAGAESFPHKPVHIVVPYPAGGPLDVTARFLAEAVRPGLGAVVVENRPGAGGNIGTELVARAVADGHTLVIGAVATLAVNPWIYPHLPYDPVRDFQPITLIASVPNVLVLNAEFARAGGVNGVRDLIAVLRARPDALRFASGGSGSAGHLAGELFKLATHTRAIHVPYRGAAPAQLALLSGEVEFMFDNLASAAARIRDGRLRALALTTVAPSGIFPDIPTLAASGIDGLAGFDVGTWFGLLAPAAIPRPVLDRLYSEFAGALRTKVVRDQLAGLGTEPAPSASPEEFAAFIQREAAKYREVARQSGATVD